MKLLIAAIALMSMFVGESFAADDDIQISRVFGREHPGGRYKHPSSFTQLENGDLYLVFYGGGGEYATDTAVRGARLKKGETEWSEPEVIADTPDRSEGNGVVWQAPDGVVWLFFLTRYGETWSTSRIKAKISKDGAKTWSDPFVLAFEEGMMIRAHPIVLNDGDYLLPIYHETGHDTEMVGPDSTSLFLRFNPRKPVWKKSNPWTETNRIRSRIGNIQPAAVQIDDNYLISYSRRGGGYEGRKDGFLVRSESHDGGRTWSMGEDSPFPNPNAAGDFIKLRNGHLLLVYNDSFSGRSPLTAAISTDNDKTYPYKRNIKEGRGSFAYPTAVQAHDGMIHVVFSSHGRTQINHAAFDESWVLSSKNE